MFMDDPDVYRRIVTHSHVKKVRVETYDLNERFVTDLSDRFLEGNVTVDGTQDVTRSCTLTLVDPAKTLGFDTDSPDDGALFMNRLVKVRVILQSRFGEAEGVVMYGPVAKVSRSAAVLSVEVQGLESFGLGPVFEPTTWPKGARKTDVIRSILTDVMGARKLRLVDRKDKLPKDLVLKAERSPWKAAMKLARSMNLQLLFNHEGVAVLRPHPGRTSWVFTDEDNRGRFAPMVLGEPSVDYDYTGVYNAVRVDGHTGSKCTFGVSVEKVVTGREPLNPSRLGLNGTKRFLPMFVENDQIRTNTDAAKVADRLLTQGMEGVASVSYETLPAYHFDPGDRVTVRTEDLEHEHRMTQFSFPLSGDGVMSVGYTSRVGVSGRV